MWWASLAPRFRRTRSTQMVGRTYPTIPRIEATRGVRPGRDVARGVLPRWGYEVLRERSTGRLSGVAWGRRGGECRSCDTAQERSRERRIEVSAGRERPARRREPPEGRRTRKHAGSVVGCPYPTTTRTRQS